LEAVTRKSDNMILKVAKEQQYMMNI